MSIYWMGVEGTIRVSGTAMSGYVIFDAREAVERFCVALAEKAPATGSHLHRSTRQPILIFNDLEGDDWNAIRDLAPAYGGRIRDSIQYSMV